MSIGTESRRGGLLRRGFLILRPARFYFILSTVISAIIYNITRCPTVEYIDSGELALACKYLGIAHPTGYPLYTSLGRLASLWPFGTLISRENMLSLIVTSLASGFIFLAISEYFYLLKLDNRRSNFIAFSISLFASFTPIWWAQGTTNEVYSLNLLLIAFASWLFFKYLNENKFKWLVLTSYVMGLSMTNHLSAVYLLPAFFAIILFHRKKRKLKARDLIFVSVFFLIPLSLYILLPIRARFSPFLNWGGVSDPYFLFKHISGWQYRIWMFADFNMAAFIDKILSTASLLRGQFGWIGLFLAGIGIIVSFIRKIYLSVFGILLIVLNFIYAANYEIVDIESYYLPMIMVFSIFMAVGVIYLFMMITGSTGKSGAITYAALAGIVLLPISGVIDNFLISDRSAKTFAEQSTMDLMDSMEPDGLAIIENWDFYSPWLYFHFEEELRPDVVLLDKELMRRSWYIDFIKREHPEIYENSSAAIEDFLDKVEPFERSRPFKPEVIDRAYYNMLLAITSNESKHRPVYTNILTDKKYTGTLPLIPTGILYKIDKSDKFVESGLFQFNKELWGSRFIHKDKRIAVILSYYRTAFSAREKYCGYFGQENEAVYYKKMTAEVSAIMNEISRKD